MFVLHVGHSVPLTTRLLAGAVAGLLAAVVTNLPMHRQSEGATPAFVVASAFSGRALTEVSNGLASAVHYGAGVLAGLLFAGLAWWLDRLLPPSALIPETRIAIAPHVVAGLLVYAAAFSLFAYLVLPAFGGEATARAETVRRQWLVTAGVYVAALLVLVPVVAMVV